MNFNNAQFLYSYGAVKQIPDGDRPEIIFSGRSNVGKSSLINKLLNRKSLARVSASPGKTATVNIYSVDNIYFADLPGYGYAKTSKSEKQRFSDLVSGYLNACISGRRDLRLVMQLVDFRHPPTANDIQMINYLIDSEIPFLVVLTKADKLSSKERAQRRKDLLNELPCAEDIQITEFSAQSGEGADRLRAVIEEVCGADGE